MWIEFDIVICGNAVVFFSLRKVITCGAPPSTSFGTYGPVQGSYNYADTVTYVCDTGYEHSGVGTLTRACGAGFTWDGSTPVCTSNN